MAHEPEPGSPPIFASTSHRNLKEMTIPELVSVLRASFRMEDFDRVEEVLMARYSKNQAQIGPLLEKFEMERLMRIHAEEELKKREELCQRGKRAQESYETLLKEVKKSGLVDKNAIAVLKGKILELEEAVEKHLETIDGLTSENRKLADEKFRFGRLVESLEKKFREFDSVHDIQNTTNHKLSKQNSEGRVYSRKRNSGK